MVYMHLYGLRKTIQEGEAVAKRKAIPVSRDCSMMIFRGAIPAHIVSEKEKRAPRTGHASRDTSKTSKDIKNHREDIYTNVLKTSKLQRLIV